MMSDPRISNHAVPWPGEYQYADHSKPSAARSGEADDIDIEEEGGTHGFDDSASSLDTEAGGRAQRAHRDAINAHMQNRLRHGFLRGQPPSPPQPQPQPASWHSPMFNPLGSAFCPSTGMGSPQWAPTGLPWPGGAWMNPPSMTGFGFPPPFAQVGRYGFNVPFAGSPGMSFSPFDRIGGTGCHLLGGNVGMALLGLGELASGIGAFIGSALGAYGSYGAFSGFRHGFGRDWCDFSPSYCGWW